MPLLGKTPFARQKPPSGLKPDDYVFFCKTTGEVFNDYEKFFDQSILCNSVIWTCAITGKTDLTFQEATESEKKALQVSVFPDYLQRPLLHLILLTCRRNVADVTDDIYQFSRKRYFLSELVELVSPSGEKKSVVVKSISEKENSEARLTNGILEQASESSTKADESGHEEVLPYQYAVEEVGTGKELVVGGECLSRKKGAITRDKCHFFIKQHCFLSDEGIWTIKESTVEKFKLVSVKFSDFFAGNCPVFNKSPKKKPVVPVEVKADDDDDSSEEDFEVEKTKKKTKESHKTKKEQDNEEEKAIIAKNKELERQQKKEELKRKLEEEKEKKREEKHKKKEEKKEQEKYLREWNRPRDDLSCEDLKDLPLSTPVTCLSEGFGDALMALEFLRSFKSEFEIDLPNNFSVATLCESITESKVEGLYANLLQQLLQAIFHLEPETNDQRQICGLPVRKLEMDSYTLTEILRLHFLRGRREYRDGFVDETTSEFIHLHPLLVQLMAKKSVFDFNAGDKLKVLSALINQLLTFPTSRALIDDNYEQLKNAQRNLRIHQISMQKREKDEIQYNARKRFEEKQKEQTKEGDAADSSNVANGKAADTEAPRKEDGRKSRKKRSITELSEKDFENMPVENIDWDQLTAEEKKCIKEWSLKKEKELLAAVNEHQPTSAGFPIGRDRTYRRYWVFSSVAGIFVEDDDEFVPDDCLVPIKQNPVKTEEKENALSYISVENQLTERGHAKWSFYGNPLQLDGLISSLNPRGFREGPLRFTLIEQKSFLADWIQKCNSNFLCGRKDEIVNSEDSNDSSKSAAAIQRGQNLAEASLEKALREMILDVEERLHLGSLGSLKQVKSRVEWRQDVERCRIGCEKTKTEKVEHDESTNEIGSSNGEKTEVDEESALRDLARALLCVGKMVEPKYLNPPLGDDEDTRKAKQKLALDGQLSAAVDDVDVLSCSGDKEPEKSNFEKWCDSVNSATSVSKLFVLMSLLETSVTWSKSALHARCRVCRRKTDGEHMLLCDGCDRGHHMYCLKPPITVIPSGDWYCPWCRPKDFIRLPSTPHKSYKELSDSELSENSVVDEPRDEEDEEEQENINGDNEEARSLTESNEDLKMEVGEEDDDDEEEVSQTRFRKANGTAGKRRTITPRRSGRGSNRKRKQDDDDEEDDDYNGSVDSSKHKSKSKRARLNESTGCKRKLKDVIESSGSTPRQSKRNVTTPAVDVDMSTRTRGRPTRQSLESAASSGKRKRMSYGEYEDDDFMDVKRKKYSPTKSHFRSAENSLTTCEELVKELMKRDEAWPFLRPVTKRDAPDYFDIVECPMDFQTIQNKIYRYQYFSSLDLLSDIRLIFSNCFLYNKPGTPVHTAGSDLDAFFNRRCVELNLATQSSFSSKHRKRTL